MCMNFYAASVALLWTTAMRFGAPDAGGSRSAEHGMGMRSLGPRSHECCTRKREIPAGAPCGPGHAAPPSR